MNDPLCVGRWWLFDSTDSLDHDQAAKLCRACPVRQWCDERAAVLYANRSSGCRPLTGTWAGHLYGAPKQDPGRLAREEAMFTNDDARMAHTAWNRGERNDRTRIGERVYQRRVKRHSMRRSAA